MSRSVFVSAALLSAACSIRDGETARRAQTELLGWSALALQACLGAPDQRTTLGDTQILSYYATSTGGGGVNVTLPIIGGGLSVSGGGYCHATVRIDRDRVTRIRYSGETDTSFASDAFCAPIVRECLAHPEPLLGWTGAAAATAPAPR